MHLRIGQLVIASAMVMTVTTGASVLSAGAAPAPQALVVHAGPLETGPTTNLVGSGSTVVFSPHKLTGLTAVSDGCSSTDYTFSIANTTSKKQEVTLDGTDFGKFPAHKALAVCLTTEETAKFGLISSPAAKLKVVVTH
jgi:hypothetical protein